jgi:hypothetical protein
VGEDAFGDGAEGLSCNEAVTGGGGGGEEPLLFAIAGRGVVAPREEEAVFIGEGLEGVLEAVKYVAEEAGAEFDGEHFTAETDFVAGADALGIFEDLHIGGIAAYAQDFGFELFVFEEDVADFVFDDGIAIGLDGDEAFFGGDDAAGPGFLGR